MIEVAAWVGIVLQGAIGLVLIGLGVLGFRLHRAERRPVPAEVDWRAERRARRRAELRAWQVDFDALLPPAAPCTSVEHNHVDEYRFDGTVWRVCVIRPPYATGGTVLGPGEQVFGISAGEAVLRIREAFGSKGAQ